MNALTIAVVRASILFTVFLFNNIIEDYFPK